ncbi:MAG: hypothetical protein OCC45_01150 [Desulfotalea sp.]
MDVDITKSLQHELEEVGTYIKFSVPEDDRGLAMELVQAYSEDVTAMRFFKEHYVSLPEALEEAVVCLRELASQQGLRCLLAVTRTANFFYLISTEQVVYAGSRVEELSDDLVRFLDQGDRATLSKVITEKRDEFPIYGGAIKEGGSLCPVCGVGEGEVHILGCLVEVCPWCGGQLSKCNCRFEKLKVDEITTEEELDQFEDMLLSEGRVPFQVEQRPAYPGSSKGFDKKK